MMLVTATAHDRTPAFLMAAAAIERMSHARQAGRNGHPR
jgi:hypothetical protein